MKSFICETDCGDMLLTIKYFPEFKVFQLYLHGIQNKKDETDIEIYQDKTSCLVPADRTAILQAANHVVHYHHYWTAESQFVFEKWFDKLWKQSHPEFDGEQEFKEDSLYIFA